MQNYSDQELEQLFRAWKSSGKTREDFCNARGIKSIKLRNWQRKRHTKSKRRQREQQIIQNDTSHEIQQFIHVATLTSTGNPVSDGAISQEAEDVSQD